MVYKVVINIDTFNIHAVLGANERRRLHYDYCYHTEVFSHDSFFLQIIS